MKATASTVKREGFQKDMELLLNVKTKKVVYFDIMRNRIENKKYELLQLIMREKTRCKQGMGCRS